MNMEKYTPEFAELLDCLPCAPDFAWDWAALEKGSLAPWFAKMAKTPQHVPWHGEGDVWAHTRMVCECLAQMADFRMLSKCRQQ